MNAVWKAAVPVALLAVLLFLPVFACGRTVMAPDPSSLNETALFQLGELSYLSARETGQTSLSYLWFGLGLSPYRGSYDCSTAGFACTYTPTSSYPDVTIVPPLGGQAPSLDISQIHVTLNKSEFTTLNVTFAMRNKGAQPAFGYIYLNESSAAGYNFTVVDPGQSAVCRYTVYPATVPSPGDHYFLKIIAGGEVMVRYVEVEGRAAGP